MTPGAAGHWHHGTTMISELNNSQRLSWHGRSRPRPVVTLASSLRLPGQSGVIRTVATQAANSSCKKRRNSSSVSLSFIPARFLTGYKVQHYFTTCMASVALLDKRKHDKRKVVRSKPDEEILFFIISSSCLRVSGTVATRI